MSKTRSMTYDCKGEAALVSSVVSVVAVVALVFRMLGLPTFSTFNVSPSSMDNGVLMILKLSVVDFEASSDTFSSKMTSALIDPDDRTTSIISSRVIEPPEAATTRSMIDTLNVTFCALVKVFRSPDTVTTNFNFGLRGGAVVVQLMPISTISFMVYFDTYSGNDALVNPFAVLYNISFSCP